MPTPSSSGSRCSRERRTERAGSLSGGEQKTVEIARALMLEPRVLLIDEPSIGLSPRARSEVFATLASLSEGGWTILLVEQNARSGLAIADRGAVLDGGVVKLTGAGSELLERSRGREALSRRERGACETGNGFA